MMLKMTILAIGICVASVGAEFGQKSLRAGGDCTCPNFTKKNAVLLKSACENSCQKKIGGGCVPKDDVADLESCGITACCATCEITQCKASAKAEEQMAAAAAERLKKKKAETLAMFAARKAKKSVALGDPEKTKKELEEVAKKGVVKKRIAEIEAEKSTL